MAAKRIILMYISEVSGHHCATVAVEKALKLIDPAVGTLNINLFNYTNPISEKVVNRIYLGVIKRTPGLWDYLYDNPSIVKSLQQFKKAIHKVNSSKLKALFDKYKPEVVVCTQAFPCGMVADFKKTNRMDLKLIAVLTDHVPHSFWVYDNVDYYVTPSEEVSARLAAKGVGQSRIKSLGIPFDPAFNQASSIPEALRKLNLDKKLPVLLIMGGGQGLGPIKTIVRSLEKSRHDFQEVIITGTNKKLYRALKKKAKKSKRKITVLGYVDFIDYLMSAAKIIITKPGGITTAEALVKKIPMVIVKPIPGQEANNADYLIGKGAAVKIDKPRLIHSLIDQLLDDPGKLRQMAEAAGEISKPNSSMDIAKLILQPS